MLWELLQQSRIHGAQSEASDANRRTNRAKLDGDQAQARIDALSLSCVAMWKLLSEELGVSEQELLAKIEEIDLRDGKLDGEIGSSTHNCPASCSWRHVCFMSQPRYHGPGPLDD